MSWSEDSYPNSHEPRWRTRTVAVAPGTQFVSFPDSDDYWRDHRRRQYRRMDAVLKEHHIGAARRASILAALRAEGA